MPFSDTPRRRTSSAFTTSVGKQEQEDYKKKHKVNSLGVEFIDFLSHPISIQMSLGAAEQWQNVLLCKVMLCIPLSLLLCNDFGAHKVQLLCTRVIFTNLSILCSSRLLYYPKSASSVLFHMIFRVFFFCC